PPFEIWRRLPPRVTGNWYVHVSPRFQTVPFITALPVVLVVAFLIGRARSGPHRSRARTLRPARLQCPPRTPQRLALVLLATRRANGAPPAGSRFRSCPGSRSVSGPRSTAP